MPMYHVTWEIEIDADTPRDAAERALEIHRNPQSIATVFTVADTSDALDPEGVEIDLDDQPHRVNDDDPAHHVGLAP